MRKAILCTLLALATGAPAQTSTSKYKPGVTPEGAVYYLPKTAVRIAVRVEKAVYTPGDFCAYAHKYLKLDNVSQQPSASYRVVGLDLSPIALADTSKCYAVKFNPKSTASNIVLADNGTLLAVNAAPVATRQPATFAPAPKRKAVSPRTVMSEEILSAGSTAKMAELTAQEIYDIRDSRNQLTRGQADFMPKDGEQLKIMLSQLSQQDEALTSMFKGTLTRDTTEHLMTYCPKRGTAKEVLFRLSGRLGLVDRDDLSGAPYYICVDDEHTVPTPNEAPTGRKGRRADSRKSGENGLYVNVPGKIKVSVLKGTTPVKSLSLYAGQFGTTELLSGELFGRKHTVHLTLDPITGAVNKLDAELPE